MAKSKIVLLPLALLFCFALLGGASEKEDPLSAFPLQIVDTEHTSLWHQKASDLNVAENADVPKLEQIATMADVSGLWSLELGADTSKQDGTVVIGKVAERIPAVPEADSMTRFVDLGLYQVGDVTFGWGSMNVADGSVAVTASGSVDGNRLNLDLLSPEEGALYRLVLNVVDASLSGSYRAYNNEGATWFGSVKGMPLE